MTEDKEDTRIVSLVGTASPISFMFSQSQNPTSNLTSSPVPATVSARTQGKRQLNYGARSMTWVNLPLGPLSHPNVWPYGIRNIRSSGPSLPMT